MKTLTTCFAQRLNKLNNEVVSPEQVMLPADLGRAYSLDEKSFYGSSDIHVKSIAEEHYGRVLSVQHNRNIQKGGVYAGAAGMVNLSYIGALQASKAILFDLNAYQKIFWDVVLDVIAATPELSEFKRQFPDLREIVKNKVKSIFMDANAFSLSDADPDYVPKVMGYRGLTSNEDLNRWLHMDSYQGDMMWQNFYSHIHDLAKDGSIAAITFDVCDYAAGQQLKQALNEEGHSHLDYIYISNIFNFLGGTSDFSTRFNAQGGLGVEGAKQNLSEVLNNDSLIISHNAVYSNLWKARLSQNVVCGSFGNRLCPMVCKAY